ncbi:BglG family transcription antiterminator [Streptococcus iniae]|uniref:PRD domain-containing protein n=2 Tax=Streptococcus iniae TaxID=1346 RepID=A0A3L8GD19_STRIN|nr:BglG family transcription antiterminator [Streptococcus iniae]AGM99873.1 BglG family transcriptional regulator [Streptococcus iniae SF1]APD32743.1 transcription antiterminator BglG [Streptococcus iniae]ASL35766.1 PTS multi-domain regulator [Streptococcus iniae]AYB01834.1 PRD domain-containing protein [Streptococcus iniae]AYB03680.1 PRD domain-containing protein [Streptococcus iniae]
MVDHKAVIILITLMTHKELSLYELSVKTKFSIKELKSYLDLLNHFLDNHHYGQLQEKNGRFSVSQMTKACSEEIFSALNKEQIYLPQDERLDLIYLYTFCRRDFVSNNHYQDFLKVSKNTTLTDIKALRQKMAVYHLELPYTRASGYTIKGAEKDKHRMAFESISSLVKSSMGIWTLEYVLDSWDYNVSYETIEQKVNLYYQTFKMSPILNRLQESIYHLIFIICRYLRPVDRIVMEPLLVSDQLQGLSHLMSSEILSELKEQCDLSREDQDYLSVLLAGSFEGEGDYNHQFFQSLTKAIVQKMQDISILNFDHITTLYSDLERHLVPAYYRLRYALPSDNEYTSRIKQDYAELFDLVKQSLEPLAHEVKRSIPDGEIAYFVLHFGGYLKKADNEKRSHYRAVIICPNGVSSSLIIKENLKILFPEISFQGVSRIDQLAQMAVEDYDMVFSTISIETQKPSYLVPMIMTEEQSFQLSALVTKDFPILGNDLEMEQLFGVIRQYASITHENELRIALKKFLRQDLVRKDYRPVLDELITEATYQSCSEQLEWRDAIRLAAKPLRDSGQIRETYPEAMIAKVEEFGPFINLGSGIAIPHARPEDGVNAVGMSMLVLEKPIYLLDDPKQEIYLLICIAAIDNETHLKALSHLTTILRSKEAISQLLQSHSYQDIKTIIKQEA